MRKLVGIVLGLTVALGLMLLAFATPAIHSGPHDVPLAVSGPEPAVARLTTMLDEQRPGAFVVTPYAYADDVTAAIEKRDAVGGVSVTPDGVTVQTASAAGAPYATLLQGVGSALAAQGQNVTYVDVVPLTADDPTGAGLSALALPLAFGGLASAVGLVTAFRHSRGLRVAGAIGFAVVAGIAVTAVLQFWLGTLDGPFWSTAAAFALGIGAISLAVLGLESLLGYPGLGLGAVVMMFVANPLSGIATGPAWLPQPWGEIGQFLPIGAAGTAIRSAAFFDGGAGRAVVVLAVWAAAGIALVGISAVRASRRATAGPS
ncbi:ABC transporter permease [Rhodococcus sp. HNM0569]|nr:ABC transporter permease [Rhodococcus sp. HNM0569]NLU83591.1 ABC transporter permease [Rhodococcus sp. HNM0569]